MYNIKIGVLANIKNLFIQINKINQKIFNNSADILESDANAVESVIDEYNAFIGED